MFDIGALELLVVVIVAVLVIGPKDMPAALRVAGSWVGKIRRASAQFRSGFDALVREAEMEDMEKKWKEQNDRIMAETPSGEMEPMAASGGNTEDVGRGYPDDLSDQVAIDETTQLIDADTSNPKAPKPDTDTSSDEPMLPLTGSKGQD